MLLDELLRGAEESGVGIEKIYISELHIQPCNQCDYCLQTGMCNIEDNMQPLYNKLLKTDWLVLASPIYFMAHCAQAKLLIDRCQAIWARHNILRQTPAPNISADRRGIFISVGATHGEKVFAGAKETMKWFFNTLEIQYWGNLLFEGIDKKGAIREHQNALKEAYKMGCKLANLIG